MRERERNTEFGVKKVGGGDFRQVGVILFCG
jgi:hypothetical protein